MASCAAAAAVTGKTTQPNWCLSYSWSNRFCGKLSVFRKNWLKSPRHGFINTQSSRRKGKFHFEKQEEKRLLNPRGKYACCSRKSTRNQRDKNTHKQICSSDTSLLTEWQHCEAQGLLQWQYDMFVFTPRCARRGASYSHWPTSWLTKEFLCPKQEDEGNSEQKTTGGNMKARLHTQSCWFSHFISNTGVFLFRYWCIQVKT